MAGFATHEVFGDEVLQEFSDGKLQSVIDRHRGIFGIGCQGPDLFLYNLPMHICGKERNVGARMHTEGTGRFFAYLWQTVWEMEDAFETEVGISYLYGLLAHYTLDSMMHPYIYARIGYDPDVPYSKKATRWLHQRLEAAIDAKFLSVKRDVLPSQYKPCESLQVDRQEKKCLADLLSKAVRRTYKINLKKGNVLGALKLMRVITCGFYGGSEKKRNSMEKWERYLSKYYLFSNLMVTDDYICKRKVMNRENMPWRNSWDYDRVSTDSVWDIYNDAVEKYGEYREEFMKLAEWALESQDKRDDEVSAEIRRAVRVLGNLSYHSGLPL